MNRYTIAIFGTRADAEKAVNELHTELGIDTDEISYVYQNTEGEVAEVDAEDVSTSTPGEGAEQGAMIGGGIGALAGLAAVAGVIPVIGPIFAAGPIVAALGVGGAIGTVAAGGLTGAAAGGLIGALVAWGAGEEEAKEYADRVAAGDILVAVHADEEKDVVSVLDKHGALNINTYTPA